MEEGRTRGSGLARRTLLCVRLVPARRFCDLRERSDYGSVAGRRIRAVHVGATRSGGAGAGGTGCGRRGAVDVCGNYDV